MTREEVEKWLAICQCGLHDRAWRDTVLEMGTLCQSWLTLEQRNRELEVEKHTVVRNFVLGKDKYCAVCGATEPCELKDDQMSPCSFDPTPMELMKDNKRLRQIVDALHADLEQAQAEIASLKEQNKWLWSWMPKEAPPHAE